MVNQRLPPREREEAVMTVLGCRCRVEFDPPLKCSGGSIKRSPGPQYAIQNDPP